ncbi:MAG TPA: DUF4124 domain-containing protein [Burkholderiales bacterium]|nr:DUF4124 domain-containing protein [Burkholderiales bacterium]
MSAFKFALGICAFVATPIASAQATVWKCVGPDGRPQYTNVQRDAQGKNCTVVTKEISVVPATKVPQGTGAEYPRVDRETQRSRDDGRRKILEEELKAEEQKLADAQAKLAEQEAVRMGDEKNYQRVLDRLAPYKEAVDGHSKNVEALKKELGNAK